MAAFQPTKCDASPKNVMANNFYHDRWVADKNVNVGDRREVARLARLRPGWSKI